MTIARMAGCWIAAFAIAIGLLAALERPARLPRADFGDADLVVIGTSLAHRAIPARGHAGELLPDRGAHIRIGLPASSRAEMLDLLDQAADGGPGTVLLEVNALIFTLSGNNANLECEGVACTIRRETALERRRLSAGMRALLGLPSAEALRLSSGLSEPAEQQWLRTGAPLRRESFSFHRQDNADIIRSVSRASARGVEIVLFLPPRSPAAERLLPEGQAEELRRRAILLAEELGLPLFAPQEGWSDADFVDRAHMSRQGRDRFLRELREWWATQQ